MILNLIDLYLISYMHMLYYIVYKSCVSVCGSEFVPQPTYHRKPRFTVAGQTPMFVRKTSIWALCLFAKSPILSRSCLNQVD